jgi:uncharacterized Rmd1/YagE family protein
MVAAGAIPTRSGVAQRAKLAVYAAALGERIDMRSIQGERLSADSVMLRVADHGYAIAFRYGCVVMFELTENQRSALLETLAPSVVTPFETNETEAAEFAVAGEPANDRPAPAGDKEVALPDRSVETLQIVADVLAESVELAHYESKIADSFDRVEPLAVELEQSGRVDRRSKILVRQIAAAVLTQHRMVGRIEIGEKPDVLWDRPDLERLYEWLSNEYELRERQLALDRKLKLVADTAELLLDLLQSKRTLRVEWYIVLLIVFEIGLTLYEMFEGH